MKKIFNYLSIMLLIIVAFPMRVNADERVVNIHLFYGETCPHCAAEEKFFDEYLEGKENIKLYTYEVWNSKENQELLKKVQNQMGNNASGVPFTIIGKKIIVGFSENYTPDELKDAIEYYLDESNSYRDYAGEITGVSKKQDTLISQKETTKIKEEKNKQGDYEKTVPVLGKINAKKVSLPLLSIVLGFVDGFNPCAMWILIFLITMLLNMKDRKKMWILGITFILTSGFVYLLFMLAWLNLATFISKISFIRFLVAFVAIAVGLVNLHNYIKSLNQKDDGCEVVDKKDRKKIMNKIISITQEKKFVLALIGMIILAASINIIELMCSIGIPLLFTQILAMNDLSTFSYITYMIIYLIFFLIDDILVFVISMITLKVTGITTKYSKYSHLIGGILMLLIGLLLIIKPELLMFNL